MRRGSWVVLLVMMSVVLTAVVGAGFSYHYDNNIERFGDPFEALPEAQRPPKFSPVPGLSPSASAGSASGQSVPAKRPVAQPRGESMTFLVLGSDSRISAGEPAKWSVGAQRTDAIMLMHVPADRADVQLVSIPRDSWVDIPGHGKNKINAAFSFGGPTLMVATVEKLTNVRIDHVMIADFTGFTSLTDSLGGVQLAGRAMNGTQALAYVRQRHGVAGNDLGRVLRQQAWMKAVVDKLISTTKVSNPLAFNRRMNSVTSLLAVDDRLSGSTMRSTALSLRGLSSTDIRTATAPVARTGWEGPQNVVYLATAEAEELWARMRTT